jgi:hypothetical protein
LKKIKIIPNWDKKFQLKQKYGVLIDMNKREKKKNKKIWEFEMEDKSKMDILLGSRD